mmetsp:Transcript_34040/g.39161  ORF Transcript_34040/g.39161 Transcript_34040/m.39161 type:complete len:83 (-) Transcript_34040:81-329(-)
MEPGGFFINSDYTVQSLRMGRGSCSSNVSVSACDLNIGRTDTATNMFRVHCFYFNRDESILLRRLLQLLTVLQYTCIRHHQH